MSQIEDDIPPVVEVPEDADLDFIINSALSMYAQQMEDMELVDPKHRIRYLEIANSLLAQAKDAMYKKEQLRMQRERLDNAAQKSKKKKGGSGDGESSEGSYSRKELLKLKKVSGGRED